MADTALLEAVQKRLAKGEPEEQIREQLAKEGWNAADINGALAIAKLRTSPFASHIHREPVVVQPKASGFLFNLLVLVMFLAAAPAAFGLYSNVVAPAIESALHLTPGALATPASTTGNPFGVVPLIPVAPAGTKAPAYATKSSGSAESHSGSPLVAPSLVSSAVLPAPTAPEVAQQTVPTAPAPTATTTPVVTPPVVPPPDTTPIDPPVPPEPVEDPILPGNPPPPPDPTDIPPTDVSSTTPPDPNTVPISVPPAPQGSYPVYSGCEAPASSYDTIVYIDPAQGSDTGDGSQAHPWKTLGTVIAQKKLPANAHVVLLPGDHGTVSTTAAKLPVVGNQSSWTWLDFQPGATIKSITLRDMHRWLITNATISDPAGSLTLFALANGSQFVIADSQLYTSQNTSSWAAADWIHADNALTSDNASCVSILRNRVTNVRHGIQVSTRAASPTPSDNSIKVLIQDNVVRNFSADGMRPLGSDVTISHNGIYDEYVSQAEGDGNHDDGIQGFALNGAIFSNVLIDRNWIQESTNPNRPFNAEMQGISSFDGVYENLRVTNNVVIVSAYHGISWYGVKDTVIDHNTVINPTTNGHKTWIYAPVGKGGLNMPSNVTVSNNTARSISGAPTGVTFTNNVVFTDPNLVFTAIDAAHNSFNLTPKPGGPLDGKSVGAIGTSPVSVAPRTAHNTALAAAPAKHTSVLLASVKASGNWLQQLWQHFVEWLQHLFSLIFKH